MISLDDIEDMTCLTRAEIAAIAEHEHIGDGNAALLGEFLMHAHKGPQTVQRMICEDIRDALHRDDLPHARELFATLRTFVAAHPEALRNSG